MSQPHIYQTKSSNQVVWKITVLNLTNLAKPDAEMRIGERTLKDAMYKNESQKQPKMVLSPGPANIQHIDEATDGMNQQSLFGKVGKSIYKSSFSLSNALVKKTRVLRMQTKQSGEILRHIYLSLLHLWHVFWLIRFQFLFIFRW